MKKIKTLVVGAHSGIGEAVVRRMDKFYTVEAERNTQRDLCMPTMKELDITDEQIIIEYLGCFGPFDEIIYTPGVARLCWARDLTMQNYIDDYKVNVFGFALLIGLHNRAWPEIPINAVAIVSDAYKNAMRGSLTYCSSKAALAAVIRGLAREMAPDSRINGVAPSIVENTPMTDYIDATVPSFRGWDPDKAKAYEASLLPMGRRATKDEIAQVVITTLYGPAYQTGSIVEITGGR